MIGTTAIAKACEVTYLTNACGEVTGHGTLFVLQDDYELVSFEDGPGVLLTYIAEIGGSKVLLANLEVPHKDQWWNGSDAEFRSLEDTMKYCAEVMGDVHSRMTSGAFLVPLDEGDPGRLVVGLAIPLDRISSIEHGKEILEKAFGSHCGVNATQEPERIDCINLESVNNRAPGGMNSTWGRDEVQFARLLAEINATQDSLDFNLLASSMDIEVDEVMALFDRADAAWEKAKSAMNADNISRSNDRVVKTVASCDEDSLGIGMSRLREANATQMDRAATRPTPTNLAKRLSPAPNKRLPTDFASAVRHLRRPYFHLDDAAYQLVLQVAGESDIVLLDGKQMTYGDADGGKALMPLARDV